MRNIRWDFPSLGTGNEQGFSNAAIETFKGSELIDNLAREICQNSLDAKLNDTLPVIVRFDLKNYDIDKYPALSSLKANVSGCKRFWSGRTKKIKENDFIAEMEETFSHPSIRTLVIRDYNTKGLTGICAGHDDDSAWRSLTNSDGSTDKEDDTSGGNFGIGKNAPFACSKIQTVFYNTRNIDGESAFQGSARWISMLDENNKKTQSIGHYIWYENEDNWKPVLPEHNDNFAKEFMRNENEVGTDVIVLGFSDTDNWQLAIKRAVLKNFFMAIADNKLKVFIESEEISVKTIDKVINDLSSDMEFEKSNTKQLYYAYTDPTDTYTFDIIEKGDVTFKIKIDESYKKVYARFRNNGMLIDAFRKRTIPMFAAVLIINHVGEKKLSKLLRAAEPPRHNTWDYKRIKDSTPEGKRLRKEAKHALERIDAAVNKTIDIYSRKTTSQQLDGGIGEYLASSKSGEDSENGTDKLKVSQKISSIRSKKGKQSKSTAKGKKSKGVQKTPPQPVIITKTPVSSGPNPPGPNPPGPTPPNPGPKPKPKKERHVYIDPTTGEKTGVAKDDGRNFIMVKGVTGDRTYPVDITKGLYKTVIHSEKDTDNVFIKVSAAREDKKEEMLQPASFEQAGVETQVNNGLIGPVALKAGVANSILIKFNEREKMSLTLLIMEEVKHEKQ